MKFTIVESKLRPDEKWVTKIKNIPQAITKLEKRFLELSEMLNDYIQTFGDETKDLIVDSEMELIQGEIFRVKRNIETLKKMEGK